MAQLVQGSQKWIRHNSLLWQRWLVTAFVLLLAPAIDCVASPHYTRLVLVGMLGLVIGIAVVRLLLRWPALGLVLLIPANMVVPFAIGTGTNTSIHATILLIALLLALWIYQMWSSGEGFRLYQSGTIPPLLLLIVVAVLAFFSGQLPWFQSAHAPLPAQLGGLSVFVLSAGAFLLAVHRYEEQRWLEWTVWLLLVLGTIYVGFRVIPGMFRYSGYFYTWGSTSSQFWTWFVVLLFSQALLNDRLSVGWRGLLWAILAVTLYSILFQTGDWKSGWIPPLIAMGAVMLLRWWQTSFLMVAGGVVGIPILIGALIASDAYSYETRIDAWMVLLNIIRVNPILGVGPANYYYTRRSLASGVMPCSSTHTTSTLTSSCRQVCWGWPAYCGSLPVAQAGWRLRNRVEDGFARAYVYGALGGLVATVASGFSATGSCPSSITSVWQGCAPASSPGCFWAGSSLWRG